MKDACKKSGGNLAAHVETIGKYAADAAKASRAANIQKEIAVAKKKAKEAAPRIANESVQVRPLFCVAMAALVSADAQSEIFKHEGAFAESEYIDVSVPMFLTNLPAVKAWDTHAPSQLTLSTWAGVYKNKLAGAANGRALEPLWQDEGNALFVALHVFPQA